MKTKKDKAKEIKDKITWLTYEQQLQVIFNAVATNKINFKGFRELLRFIN